MVAPGSDYTYVYAHAMKISQYKLGPFKTERRKMCREYGPPYGPSTLLILRQVGTGRQQLSFHAVGPSRALLKAMTS